MMSVTIDFPVSRDELGLFRLAEDGLRLRNSTERLEDDLDKAKNDLELVSFEFTVSHADKDTQLSCVFLSDHEVEVSGGEKSVLSIVSVSNKAALD